MKNRLLKTFTSLVLTVLMVLSIMPAFAITIGAEGGTYKLVTDASTLAVGDKVIIVATGSDVAMSTTQKTNNRGQTAVEKNSDGTITIGADVQVFTLEQGTVDGTFAFKTDSGYIYAASSSSNNLKTQTTNNANGSWTISITDSVATITAQGSYTRNLLKYNNTNKIFSCYASGMKDVSIYKLATNTEETTTETACEHTNTTSVAEVPATCTTPGTTAGEVCSNCGEIIEEQTVIPATGHTYENGICTVCGEKQPPTLTINRNSFDTASSYAWYGWSAETTTGETINGSGFIYGTTTNSIQMNSGKDGYHIYNTSALPGKIVSITLTAADGIGTPRDFYVLTSDTAFGQSTPDTTNATKHNVTTSGATWESTEFTTSGRYFAIVVTGGAAYLSSIEITYEVCSHAKTEPVDVAKTATCTEDGITEGLKCSDCGEILEAQATIPATGHKDDNTDGYCDVCKMAMCEGNHNWNETERKDATCTEDGFVKYECSKCHETKNETLTANGHTEVIDKAVAATCTATGLTEGKHCSVCDTVLVEQTETPIIGHNYVDGTCTMCGKAEPVLPFKVGDVVIFTGSQTNSGKNYEFSGFDSKQTYGCAEEYSGYPAGMFPITIVEGNQSGTFAFKNGDNYITRNEGNIELSTELGDNSSWIAELDGDGNLVIKSYTGQSYKLQFNANNPRFKVYTSNQQPIKVVKYPTIKTFGLSLNEGVTVKVTFDIPEAWLNSNTGAKVVFSNGESFDAKAGVDVYSVKLTPAQINDDLTVKIQLSDGSDYGATNNVSVSAYKAKVKAAYESGKLTYTDEKYNALLALIDAALTYSNAADGAINEALKYDFTGVADHTHSGELFTSFAGKLGTYASIYINVDTSKVPESGDTLVLTVGGTEIINGLQIANYITKDGQIVISGLFPANFDDTIYIEASTEGSNATFTFNSYLKAIYNDNSSTQRVKNLAVVTYLYGLAAEAYLATLK